MVKNGFGAEHEIFWALAGFVIINNYKMGWNIRSAHVLGSADLDRAGTNPGSGYLSAVAVWWARMTTPRQYQLAGPMLLKNPTDSEMQSLRGLVFQDVKRKAKMDQIAFFFVDDGEDRVLHVYAKAYNKLSEAMWRQYMNKRFERMPRIAGSFKDTLQNARKNNAKAWGFEHYTTKPEKEKAKPKHKGEPSVKAKSRSGTQTPRETPAPAEVMLVGEDEGATLNSNLLATHRLLSDSLTTARKAFLSMLKKLNYMNDARPGAGDAQDDQQDLV